MPNNKLFDKDYLYNVASFYCNRKLIRKIKRIGYGNINDTFLVYYLIEEKINTFVLQRINNKVFPNPYIIVNNIKKLNDHIKQKENNNFYKYKLRHLRIPEIMNNSLNGEYLIKNNSNYWRAITYIKNGKTYQNVESCQLANEVGIGLGIFHSLIKDMDPNNLLTIIEDFHSISKYLEIFDKSKLNYAKNFNPNNLDLNSRLTRSFNYIDKHRDFISQFELRETNLNRSITHGDLKINNFIFDSRTSNISAIIDLDTLQSGYILDDIADCLRSICNSSGENSKISNDIKFNIYFLESFLSGYLNSYNSKVDLKNSLLPYLIKLPLELGIRFLTDHLNGNIYFKVNNELTNLNRAEVQFKLASSLECQYHSILNLIHKTIL